MRATRTVKSRLVGPSGYTMKEEGRISDKEFQSFTFTVRSGLTIVYHAEGVKPLAPPEPVRCIACAGGTSCRVLELLTMDFDDVRTPLAQNAHYVEAGW